MLTVDSRVDLGAVSGGAETGAIAFDRMEGGGLDAAFFIVPVPRVSRTPEGYESARRAALGGIARLGKMIQDRASRIGLGLSPEDAYRLEKEGRHTAFIGLASGDALGNDLSLVEAYHAKGVRLLILCGESDNAVCDSALDRADPEDRGLSEFGKRVIAECNRAGLVIDVAGCSERSIEGVLAASRAPIVCSRAGASRLSGVPGNLSDGMITAIAAHEGVILVTFDPARLVPPERPRRAGVSDIAEHVEYVMKLAGPESVGIGSCFGGGGGVPGCRNTSEMLELTIELLRRGHAEKTVEAVWGGNIMSVFKRVAGGAGNR